MSSSRSLYKFTRMIMKSFRDNLAVLVASLLFHLPMVSAQQPQQENVKLSYYDALNPQISVLAPEVYGTVALVALSERFTLPKAQAYLDSVRIHFDGVEGERVVVRIHRDTLISINGVDHHFINISPTATIYSGEFSIEEIAEQRGTWLTVPLPHVKVPQEFHVVIYGMQTGPQDFSSRFWLLGDRFYDQPPTLNSRSGYFASTNPDDLADIYPGLMDGFFTLNGLPIAIEFHIEAFVDVTSSSVKERDLPHVTVYPNPIPSNAQLHISHQSIINAVRITNMLGDEVLRWEGNSMNLSLSLSTLTAGTYNVLIDTRDGVVLEKFIVQ
jgi:hypothetical protein